MANEGQTANLIQTVEQLRSIDREQLLRPSLGTASLEKDLIPKLEALDKRVDLILQSASDLPDDVVENLSNNLLYIHEYMNNQSGRAEAAYVAEKQSFLQDFQTQFDGVSQYWPHIIAATIESRGFLEDEGIKKAYDQAIETMEKEAETTLNRIKEEANKTINEARTLADGIENRARQTASGISIEAAQEQFRLAQQDHDKQVIRWTWLNGISIFLFFGVAVIFFFVDLPKGETKSIIYFSAVRITIIGALGGIVAFCLRMLRAHMHMAQHNRHRQRVTNSIAAFVESAATPEQRDLILSQLVDSIAHFGSSGILRKEDESIQVPKVVVDNLSRTITSPQTQPRQ